MEALYAEDWQRLVEFEGKMFLEDGQVERLIRASVYAEKGSGWREGALWALRALLLNPRAIKPALRVLAFLYDANRFEQLRQILQILGKGQPSSRPKMGVRDTH